MTKIVSLPDGYNGDTELFFTDPIETSEAPAKCVITKNGQIRYLCTQVKLRCARPGYEYMFRWVCKEELERIIACQKDTTQAT